MFSVIIPLTTLFCFPASTTVEIVLYNLAKHNAAKCISSWVGEVR